MGTETRPLLHSVDLTEDGFRTWAGTYPCCGAKAEISIVIPYQSNSITLFCAKCNKHHLFYFDYPTAIEPPILEWATELPDAYNLLATLNLLPNQIKTIEERNHLRYVYLGWIACREQETERN